MHAVNQLLRLNFVKQFRLLDLLGAFALFAPILMLGMQIAQFGVNVPMGDQWELVPIFQAIHNDTFQWSMLWAQHNEHRPLFPRLIMIGAAFMTNWDIRVEIWCNFLLAIGIFLVIARIINLTMLEYTETVRLWLKVSASFLIFSPVQWENWLFGWDIQWYLAVLGIAITTWALFTSENQWRFRTLYAFALIATVVACYSLASAFVLWVLGAAGLLLQRRSYPYFILWFIGAVTTIGLYWFDYHNPAGQPNLWLFLDKPGSFLEYIATYMGRGISYSNVLAVFVGGLILLCFLSGSTYLVIVDRAQALRMAPWFALGTLVLFNAVSIGAARLEMGVTQAASSRYTTISLLLVLSTVAIMFATLITWARRYSYKSNMHVALPTVFAVLFIELLTSSYVDGRIAMKGRFEFHDYVRRCIAEPETATKECLLLTYPNEDAVRSRAIFLKQQGWSNFGD